MDRLASQRELQALIVLAGKVDPSLQNALRKAQSETDKTSGKMAALSKAGAKVSSGLGKVVRTVAVPLVAGISLFGAEGVKLASDLAEVQNVVDVTFSKSADQINKWSQGALKAYGLSELQAKQYSSTLGAMMKSSGITGQGLVDMSEKLAGLSGDLASFYNLSTDEAFEKIRSGISGETEPLKQLGINMSVANMETFALSKGIKTSYQKMDQASQTLLRYNYLMSVSKDAQGDFVRTSGGFANQARLLKTSLQQLAAKAAQTLLPVLTQLAQKANQFIEKITNNPETLKKLQNVLMSVANVIGTVAKALYDVFVFISDNWPVLGPIIWGVVAALSAMVVINKVSKLIGSIGEAFTFITSKAGLVTLAIGALVTAGIWLYKNWDKVMKFLSKLWDGFKILISNVANFFSDIWNGVIDGFKSAWEGISDFFTGLWNGVLDILKTTVNSMITVINGVIDGINLIPGTIGDVIGVDLRIPNIPYLAKGGLANQPSICGEAGPEMVVPIKYKNPRSLSLLNQTAKAIGAGTTGGGPSYQITYAPVIYGGDKAEIQSALEADKAKFAAWFEEFLEQKERVSFG